MENESLRKIKIPDLSDHTFGADEIDKKGSYAAFVPWATTKQVLREKAPEWLPFSVLNNEGGIEHETPNGSFLLLVSFRHLPSGYELPPVPHGEKLPRGAGSRELADAYLRGVCKAAAFHFGLGWKLWAREKKSDAKRF